MGTPKGIMVRYTSGNAPTNVLNEKVHKYSNTRSVLTMKQNVFFFWELNTTTSPHYLHLMNHSDTTKHHWQPRLLDYFWKALWLQLYSVEGLPRGEVSSHLRSNSIYLCNSVLSYSDTSGGIVSFHTLGWCFGFCGLSPICPGLPGALQS